MSTDREQDLRMGFDWRTEWSAFKVALVTETAKRYVGWHRESYEEWDSWEEHGPTGQKRLEDQFAAMFLAQDEARISLLRRSLTPPEPPKDSE